MSTVTAVPGVPDKQLEAGSAGVPAHRQVPGGGAPIPHGLALMSAPDEWRAALDEHRGDGRTVGLVPTMGALHEGHASLIRRAASECGVVAVTVFVNPLQFGDPDDLARYPRQLEADLRVARAAGAELVFAPAAIDMYPSYPDPPAVAVTVSGVGDQWEGAARPGHFDGVATVVTKLFALAGPCRAYFGEKDFQQLAVVRQLVREFSLPVAVEGCPTVRESDGLAMSSRNARLGTEERRAAAVLAAGLRAGAAAMADGEYRRVAVEAVVTQTISREPLVELEYVGLVKASDLTPARNLTTDRPLRLLVAARVGEVRLIDNLDPEAWASSRNGESAPNGRESTSNASSSAVVEHALRVGQEPPGTRPPSHRRRQERKGGV